MSAGSSPVNSPTGPVGARARDRLWRVRLDAACGEFVRIVVCGRVLPNRYREGVCQKLPKKCASACGRWRRRVKTTPLTCRVNAKHAFVALNRPLVPYPRCANIHSRAFWQQPMKRDRIWSPHPLGLLLARALGSRGLPLGSGALFAHAAAALSGPLVAVGAAFPPRTRLPSFPALVRDAGCGPFAFAVVAFRSGCPSLPVPVAAASTPPSLILPAPPDSRTFSLAVSV